MGDEGFKRAIVVFCRLVSKRSILLIRRMVPPHLHQVTIPGGRKEPMESLQAACIREMKEETGLRVESPLLSGVVSFISPVLERETLCFYFTASHFSGTLRSSPEGDVFWVPLRDSYKLENASPFYRLIGPFLVGRKGVFLVGTVRLGPDGEIRSHDLHWQ